MVVFLWSPLSSEETYGKRKKERKKETKKERKIWQEMKKMESWKGTESFRQKYKFMIQYMGWCLLFYITSLIVP